MCLVSVVIPAYKATDFIRTAVDSIHGTIDYEIIVVIDDDGTVDEYQKAAGGVRKVNFYKNSKNMGVTYSRNKGYFRSKGEIVVFLDADDELTVKIDCLWSEIKANYAGIYFFRCIDDDGAIVGTASAGEGRGVNTITEMINMNNHGERLVAVRKNAGSYPPFIALTRGHEMAGLLRFSKLHSCPNVFYSSLTARQYRMINQKSLSRMRKNNSRFISIGHYLVFIFLFKRCNFASMTWLLKSVVRRLL